MALPCRSLTIAILGAALAMGAQSREEPVGLVLSPGGSRLQRANTETSLAARAGDLLFTGDTLRTESATASFLFCPAKTTGTLSASGEARFETKHVKVRTGTISEQPAQPCALPPAPRTPVAARQHYGVTMTRGANRIVIPPAPRDQLPVDVQEELGLLDLASNDPAVLIAAARVFEKHGLTANALEPYYKLLVMWPDAAWVRSRIFDLEKSQAESAVATEVAEGHTFTLRLTDEKATTAAIRNEVHDVLKRRAGKNDTVVISVSDLDKNGFLPTSDSDPRDLAATAFPIVELRAVIEDQQKKIGRVMVNADGARTDAEAQGTPQHGIEIDKFNDAIAAGRLLPDETSNAFDALDVAQPSVTTEQYRELGNQLRVALENRGQEVLRRDLADAKNPPAREDFVKAARWMEAARMLTRESLLLEARQNYFQGRANFDVNLLEQAVRIDPGAAYGYNGLGLVYLEQGQFPEAITAFHDAARRAQRWPSPQYNLGLVYEKMNRQKEAEAAFRKARQRESALERAARKGSRATLKRQ